MIELAIAPGVSARSLAKTDVAAVHALMTESRNHLDRWLRWSSAIRTPDDVQRLVERFEMKESVGDGFHLGIWNQGELAGGVVCWYVHSENRNAEIGYWLGERFQGRGLATSASSAVLAYLFQTVGLNRVEMQCGVENAASRAVAERCGLVAEGIRRESHWITDRFVDHVCYSVLQREFNERQV